MRSLVKQSFNPEKDKRNYSQDQADIRDVFNSPERLNAEELSIAQDSYIPMTFTNTTPMPEDQNPVMKAVVGGSAVDIIKAMQQQKQRNPYVVDSETVNAIPELKPIGDGLR